MKEGYVRQVLTTNFDLLIETALEALGCRRATDFSVCSTDEQFRKISPTMKLPAILKIHGSADEQESIRITLSLVARQELSESRAHLLEHFMTSNGEDVLILGYSTGDHFDINPALSRLRSNKRIFFVDHRLGQRRITQLPKVFSRFHGCGICCHTGEVLGCLRKELNENLITLCNQHMAKIARESFPTKNWRSVIDEWANRFILPMRFFVIATILYALQRVNESRELYRQARELFVKFGDGLGIGSAMHQLANMRYDTTTKREL